MDFRDPSAATAYMLYTDDIIIYKYISPYVSL
jgi:hypothetical protein